MTRVDLIRLASARLPRREHHRDLADVVELARCDGDDGGIRSVVVRVELHFVLGEKYVPENINAVAFFAPDGKHVFAVFRDGRGYRWDVRAASWDRQACQIAGRRLTRAEWQEALPDRAYAPAC